VVGTPSGRKQIRRIRRRGEIKMDIINTINKVEEVGGGGTSSTCTVEAL
jgi:hypothetical protein